MPICDEPEEEMTPGAWLFLLTCFLGAVGAIGAAVALVLR